MPDPGTVTAVSRNSRHVFSKQNQLSIRLVAGLGVEGDAHAGATVQHIHTGIDPAAPNLRQVHLMHEELFDELAGQGFTVGRGDLGENITTRGLDLLALPAGTRLNLGAAAVIEVTGLRTPCFQINRFREGLVKAVLGREPQGRVTPKTGVMGIVLTGGDVRTGDTIAVSLPPAPHVALAPV